MFRILLVAVLCSISTLSLAFDPGGLFKNEILVSRDYEVMDKVSLQTAPVRYLDKERELSGYASGGEISVVGKAFQYVLDHQAADSNMSIYAHYHDALTKKGYEIAFDCEGMACGDSAGWRLLLGRELAGHTENQLYLLAYKGVGGLRGEYVSVYVNEVDDQPRSLVKVVTGGTVATVRSLPQSAGEVSLFYPVGEIEIGLKGLIVVEAIAQALNRSSGGRVVINGYADGEPSERNAMLASGRADTVYRELLSRLNSSYADVSNGGGLVGQGGNRSQANRRVDLTVILPDEAVVQRDGASSRQEG